MNMHCSSMTGTFLLALLATWSLLAQLGSSQRIMNLRNHNLDGTFPRDLRPSTATTGDDFTYLRVRKLGLTNLGRDANLDNPDLAYPNFIAQIRSMLGEATNHADPGGVTRTYRQLVRDATPALANYIYIPFASRNDRGISAPPPNEDAEGYQVPQTDFFRELELDEAERGFILRRDNLYFVAARVGNTFTSFGQTAVDGIETFDSLRLALVAMTGDGPNQISDGWTLRRSGAIGLAYGVLGELPLLTISAGCINVKFEHVFQYASQPVLTSGPQSGTVGPAVAGISNAQVGLGVMTAAVVISEALRLPAVAERIGVALSASYRNGYLLGYPAGLGGSSLAAVVPLQWSRLSTAVRLGQAAMFDVTNLNVVDDNGVDITEISQYVNVAVLTAINPNDG